MVRTLLFLAIVATQLAAPQLASCRPPEEVPNSPIPPLHEQQQQRSARAGRGVQPAKSPTHQEALRATSKVETNRPSSAEPSSQLTSPVDRDDTRAVAESESTSTVDSERLAIWNSPEMLAARRAVVEFCAYSAQSSPKDGEQFLARLAQLSPKEMQEWLDRFQMRRANISRGREANELARQVRVNQTTNRLEAMRRAAANAEGQKRQAAAEADYQEMLYRFEAAVRPQRRGRYLPVTRRDYDPLEAVIDPMSPRGYARKVAAALSLPGDLPRSDPRNFIRGERGQTFIDAPAAQPDGNLTNGTPSGETPAGP